MITYNELYETLRKERYSEQLQALPKEFIEQTAEYFTEKKTFTNKTEDLFSDVVLKDKKKLENAIAIFKELLLRRRKKLLNLAFVASETGISKKDFDNMTCFERELFEEIVKSMEKAEKTLSSMMTGQQKSESNCKLVRFLEDVSEFLDFEGNTIGPFEKGEVANMNKEIVEILSKDKRVDIIEDD